MDDPLPHPLHTAPKQSRALRIAMLGHKRIPGREGGVEIVVSELATRMVAMGCQVDVFNRWDLFTEGGKAGDAFYRGVRIRQVPTLRSSKVNAFLYSILASIRVLFGRYDIIHYHAIGSCAMLWLPHLFGRKTVVTVHGLDWQRAKWNQFAVKYLLLGEKTAARYADEIIVLSTANQRYFNDVYGRCTNLIPNGIEEHVSPEPDVITAQYGLNGRDYVLFLARIVPEKGLHYLIEAFQELPTDQKLVIAGNIDLDDLYCQKIRNMAAKDSRILMVGMVRGRVWEELFGNCSLYVLPSDIEGMPMSLLEALSFGCRCLVSDIDENIEAGKGCVSLFRHGDIADLRQQMKALLDDPQAGLPAATQAKWADWDEVTRQTLDLYARVTSKEYVPTRRDELASFQERRKRRILNMRNSQSQSLFKPAVLLSLLLPAAAIAYVLLRPGYANVHWCAAAAALAVSALTHLRNGKAGCLAGGALFIATAALTLVNWPEQRYGLVFWAIWLALDLIAVSGMGNERKRLLAQRDHYCQEAARVAMMDPVTQLRNLHAFQNDTPIYIKISRRYHLTLVVATVKLMNADAFRAGMSPVAFDEMLEDISTHLRKTIRLDDVTYFIDPEQCVWCINMFTNADALSIVFDRISAHLNGAALLRDAPGLPTPLFAHGYAVCDEKENPNPLDLLKKASQEYIPF